MTTIPCICPPAAGAIRHPDGDTLTFRERLDARAGTTIWSDIALLQVEDPDNSPADRLALLTDNYLLFGIEAWSVVDAAGKPVPVTRGAIRTHLLTRPEVVVTLIGDTHERYGPQVVLPLLQRALESSETSPTDASTSPPTDSTESRPRPSKRSSISTIQTVDTGTTTASDDGDSSSSPSSASAA
jgi:hypothetical protein